jgi:hypothetical protein
VWRWNGRSKVKWEVLTNFAEFPERGGLQLLAFPDSSGVNYLWVIGGRGGDNDGASRDVVYYADMWRAQISTDGKIGRWVDYSLNSSTVIPWSPRAGHVAILETATAGNGYQRRLYNIGGDTGNRKEGFSDETWVLQIDNPSDFWRLDFQSESLYLEGTGNNVAYRNNSPAIHYVGAKSPLDFMVRFWLPLKASPFFGTAPELRPYVSGQRLKDLNSLDLHTIQDLAVKADVYAILKLRGYDFPGVTERMNFYDICDVRALAKGILDKCHVSQKEGFFDGEQQMPWNVVPQWAGPPPIRTGPDDKSWHGRNYMFLQPRVSYEEQVSNWDGCTKLNLPPLEPLAFNNKPNVEGLGWVDEVTEIKSPDKIINELQCRYTPRRRAFHSGLLFEERVYIFGGKSDETLFNANTW